MDTPDSLTRYEPLWPSVEETKVTDASRELSKTPVLNMDCALALLRKELAAMQREDKKLHKQLLVMRSSITSLKDELRNERERYDMESHADDRERISSAPAPGYVTKVEIIANDRTSDLKINHVKQDSGILTDEDDSDREEESVQRMLKTYPPMGSRGRSYSFSFSGSYETKLDEGFDEESKRRSGNFLRARARSVAGIENERLSSFVSAGRTRSQTLPESSFTRFNSMPVINEIPSDSTVKNTPKSKTFAVYGFRRRGSLEEGDEKTVYSGSKKLPVAFGVLTRHGSLPVMYSSGRPRQFDNRHGSVGLVTTQAIWRSSSQLVLSKPTWEKAKEKGTNQMKAGRIYRSSSQISLV